LAVHARQFVYQKMVIMLDPPGSRMIIFAFLKTQDGEDRGRTQTSTAEVKNWSTENLILSNIARTL